MTDWEVIVRDHGQMVYDTAWRILGNAADSEDAAQEAFLDALRLQRNEMIDNWGGLLRHLGARRALDIARRRREVAGLKDEPQSQARPDAVAIERELAGRLRAALVRLPAREAEVFILRYFAEMENPDIAAAIGINTGAVAVALHKARQRLQELLVIKPGER